MNTVDLATQSDDVLVSLYIEGNAEAFNHFYLRHHKNLFTYIKRRLAFNQHAAEDVFHNLWEEWMLKCLEGTKEPEELGIQWLMQYAKWRIQDYRDDDSRTTPLEVTEDGETFSHEPEGNQTDVSEESELVLREIEHVIEKPVKDIQQQVHQADTEFEKVAALKKLEKITKERSEMTEIYELTCMKYTQDEIVEITGLSKDQVRYRTKVLYSEIKAAGLLQED